MLEKNRVAAEGRVEKAEVKHALEAGQEERDGDDRSSEDKDDARGVMGPDKERETEPGHPGSAHGVDGNDEIQAGEDGRKTVDEDPNHGGSDRGIGVHAAEWRVKGPPGVQTAGGEGIEDETAPGNIDIPAQKVELRKGHVLRSNHQRDQEIAEDRRDRGNQKEEDHSHAVHGEE